MDGWMDAWMAGEDAGAFSHQSNYPVIHSSSFLVVAGAAGIKNPTTVSSRGFLSKFNLTTTSADGVVRYDDQNQSDMSNVF
jgi:hypothetical protein